MQVHTTQVSYWQVRMISPFHLNQSMENPMLQSVEPNTNAMMGLILSTTGLLIVGGTLVLTIILLFSQNPIHTTTEMNHLTDIFSQHLFDIDAAWYEKQTHYLPPSSDEPLNFYLSSEHILIETNTPQKELTHHTKLLPIPIWIRTSTDPWMTASELHNYLQQQSGKTGFKHDPLPITDPIYHSMNDAWLTSQTTYLHNPFCVDTTRPIFMEKTYVYYDENLDGCWTVNESFFSFTLVYQKPIIL